MTRSTKITKDELRTLLKRKRIATTHFAEFLGVSPRTVQKWLSEKPVGTSDAPATIPRYVEIILNGETLDEFLKKRGMEEWQECSARNREHIKRTIRGIGTDKLF